MATSSSFTDNINKIQADTSTLSEVAGYPATEFARLQSIYQEFDEWYSGDELTEQQQSAEGNQIDTYPTQYNPIPDAVEKHVSMLFGHYDIQDTPIVRPIAVPLTKDKEAKTTALDLQKLFDTIFYENNANALFLDNGMNSQIYGGCIFKVLCEPSEDLDPMYSTAIRISNPHPRYFVAIPSGTDFWDLQEVWVVRPISVLEAKTLYGITYDSSENKNDDDTTWLVEYSSKTRLKTTVDNKVVTRTIGNEKVLLDQPNPYGIVPYVYIPHVRKGQFYGESMINGTIGLVKEMNLRLSDYGDAVSSDSHTTIVVSGQSDYRIEEAQKVSPRVKAIKVKLTGMGNTGTAKDSNPDVFQLQQTAHTSMGELVDKLLDLFAKTVHIPPVAYGTDEGSQRSSATLVLRMWPLISHAQLERVYWTVGLNRICKIIVRMLSVKFPGKYAKFKNIKIKQDWAPYLPKDREEIINEAVSRFGTKMTSFQKIQEILGDVEDPDEEYRLVMEAQKEMMKLAQEFAPKPAIGSAPTGKKLDSDKDKAKDAKKEDNENQQKKENK
jgi:hypothetical protein